MLNNNEINEIVFSNYEDLRNQLVGKYNLYIKVKGENSGMFHGDIDKNFLQMVHLFITYYIIQRTATIPIDEIKIWTEDKFSFDNIQRIISEEGGF